MYTKFLFVFITCFSFVACQHQVKSDDNIVMTGAWQLQRVASTDSTLQLNQNTLFTLEFDGDGNAHGVLGCNRWHAQLNMNKSGFDIEAATTTRKRCRYTNDGVQLFSSQYLPALTTGVRFAEGSNASSAKQLVLEISTGEQWFFLPLPQ